MQTCIRIKNYYSWFSCIQCIQYKNTNFIINWSKITVLFSIGVNHDSVFQRGRNSMNYANLSVLCIIASFCMNNAKFLVFCVFNGFFLIFSCIMFTFMHTGQLFMHFRAHIALLTHFMHNIKQTSHFASLKHFFWMI